MKDGIFGKYFSKNYTSTAEQDLIASMKTDIGVTTLIPKKLTFVAKAETRIKINDGVYSDLYQTSTGDYCLSLDGGDVIISSFVIETADVICFVAIIY